MPGDVFFGDHFGETAVSGQQRFRICVKLVIFAKLTETLSTVYFNTTIAKPRKKLAKVIAQKYWPQI